MGLLDKPLISEEMERIRRQEKIYSALLQKNERRKRYKKREVVTLSEEEIEALDRFNF